MRFNQSRIKGARRESWSGIWTDSEDEQLKILTFYSYRSMKQYQRCLRMWTLGLTLLVIIGVFLSFVQISYWKDGEHIRDRILKKAGLESNQESITGAYRILQIISESFKDAVGISK